MSEQDPYAQRSTDVASQARALVAVTPDDDNDLTVDAKALYIGTGGDLTIIPINNDTPVTLANHPIGYCPVQVRRVMETGTDADDIVAMLA